MKHSPHHDRDHATTPHADLAAAAILALTSGLLAACSSSAGSSTPTLVWYINPDAGGQAKVAENCSTDDYTITTQVLPQDANEQRIQLARRLAAQDSGHRHHEHRPAVHRGVLERRLPRRRSRRTSRTSCSQQSFKSATDAATWDGQLVVAPFWSNTQVLWYRKSFVEKAGIDMSKPVTWDQIIDAAAKNGGKVAVQANKYEGYVVWINALISGAGGEIATDTDKGVDMKLEIDSPAGEKAAAVIEKLAHSSAAPADLSVAQRGHRRAATFATAAGLVHGQLDLHLQQLRGDRARASTRTSATPATRRPSQGEQSRPPYGGIGLGVSAYSNHVDEAMEAVECITSPENQEVNAELTGNMPASAGRLRANGNALQKIYPADLLELFQQSLDEAAPRTVDAVLERHLRRPPVHLAPAVERELVDAGRLRRRSSTTSSTEGACCDHLDGDRRDAQGGQAQPAASR